MNKAYFLKFERILYLLKTNNVQLRKIFREEYFVINFKNKKFWLIAQTRNKSKKNNSLMF